MGMGMGIGMGMRCESCPRFASPASQQASKWRPQKTLQSTKRGCVYLSQAHAWSDQCCCGATRSRQSSRRNGDDLHDRTESVDQSFNRWVRVANFQFQTKKKYIHNPSERTKLEHFHFVVCPSVCRLHSCKQFLLAKLPSCSWSKICWHSEPLDHLTMEFAYSKTTTT